jgi:hypothetical protein
MDRSTDARVISGGGIATLGFRADLRQPRVLLSAGSEQRTRLRIRIIRRAAADLDLWERRQNYRAFADAEGMVDLIECLLLVEPPAALLEDLRRQPMPTDPTAAAIRGWRESGEVRLGAPLAVIPTPAGGRSEVALRIDRARIDLVVDGRLIDRDWPCGSWIGGDAEIALDAGVEAFIAWDHAVSDAERGWTEDADPPLAQHWAPSGHNAFAGDTMWCVSGDRLHLYWLPDRHAGESKWGAGVGQFAHHSTSDLRSWRQHPLAYPLTEPHELALGTGAVIEQDGVFHLYSRHCQERFGPLFEALHPGGMHHATSRDGERFVKLGQCPVAGSGRTRHDLGSEPGMLRDEAGLWHAAAAGTRLTSSDLHHWTVADAEFLPPVGWPCTRYVPPSVPAARPADYVVSNECTCWFRWGGWHYVLSGRTGYWMSRALLGPYWGSSPEVVHPAWDPYDGLIVPQAIEFRGRCILSGWLAQREGYAGHLVFRELHQRPDGNLEMRRLPELEPRCGEALRWTAPSGPGVSQDGGLLLIDARAAARSALIAGVGSDIRITARLRSDGCARYGLRFLAPDHAAPGCELRLEPARSLAQWGPTVGGSPAPNSAGLPFDGRDFTILGVEGLDRAITLDLLVRREPKSGTTIIDAELDGRRTLITRRDEQVDALAFWADSGALTVDGLEIRRLAERIAG